MTVVRYAGLAAAATALVLAIASARAADISSKSKSDQYIKICSAYGEGYFYIPGSDTCLKIGGYVRMDTYIAPAGSLLPGAGFGGSGQALLGFPFRDDTDPQYLTLARGMLELDARTEGEYGTLRSYMLVGEQWTTPNNGGGPSLNFERAYIQFAGLTFGYTQSFFDTGIAYSYAVLLEGSNTWTTTAAYTVEFGSGWSTSLALEDAANRVTGVQATGADISLITAPGVFPYLTGSGGPGLGYESYTGGQTTPDLVANLRLDQAWGSVQIAGALHKVQAETPLYLGAPYLGADGLGTWGYGLGAYAELKLPQIAPGDSLYLQVNFADGAINYAGLAGGQQGRAQGIGSINVSNTGLLSGAFYTLADAVMGPLGDYETVKVTSMQAQFRHFWTPSVRSAVFGGYSNVDMPDNVVGAMSFGIWQLGANSIWSPARNFDIGAELVYTRIDGDEPLGLRNAVTKDGSIAPTLAGGSTSGLTGAVRIERRF